MTGHVLLGEVIDVASGQVDPRTEPYLDLPHVGGDNIESGSGRLFGLRTARELNLISGKYEFGPDDVLYSKIRPALNKVALPDFAGICSADMYPLRPRPDRVDRRFLAYILRQNDFLTYAEKHSSRTNIPKINRNALLAYRLRLPPLAAQRRIADILDKADAVRRKRKEAIALTEELLRSAFLNMFGDPVTNPKGWPVKPLAKLGELDRGRSRHRPRNDPRLLGGSHPLIQTGEVANCDGVIRTFEHTYSDIGLSQSKLWPTGTLCITIAANIAKTGVLGFDACFPDSVVGFTPGDEATTEYVQYWLGFLQPVLERQAPQSAQKNINLEILRTLLIPAPDMVLQRRFSAVVTKIRGSRNRMRDAHDSSEGLFRALVARSFSRSAAAQC